MRQATKIALVGDGEREEAGGRGYDGAEAVLRSLRRWRITYADEPPSGRLLAAVLFVADGDADDLAVGFGMAKEDWRDLLVAAGLAHSDWPAVLSSRLGPSASS